MRIMLALLMCVGVPAPALAQDFGKIAAEILHQRLPGDRGDLSRGDVVSGLREALEAGAAAASAQLAVEGGYMADEEIRIPLPDALADAQRRLKPFGMSGPLDDLQLRINHAAEAAAPTAGKLVMDTVKAMTFEDAMGVLRGGDTAATDFLRARAEPGLRQAFRPYFETALGESGALTAVDAVVTKYGGGLVRSDARGWLTDHAVGGALDGLFYYVAREEQAIRHDPVKRTSDLLRRVFGG